MAYFHHQSIKKNTVAILDLFNDIEVVRFNDLGEQIKSFKVPIVFGGRDKLFQVLDHSNQNLNTRNLNVYPRMALSFDGLTRAQNRDTNKLQKINKTNGTETIQFQFNPVAYDFNFTLNIATRTFTDMTVIIEQIAPYFRPTKTLYIKEIDIQDVPSQLTLSISDFAITIPDIIADEEIRIIECQLPLTLRGNLYLPIMDADVLSKIKLYLSSFELEDLNAKAVGYGLNEIYERNAASFFQEGDVLTGEINSPVIERDSQTGGLSEIIIPDLGTC